MAYEEPLKVSVIVEDDAMTATCKVSGSTSQLLTQDALKKVIIEEEQIRFGIDENAINQLLIAFQKTPKKLVQLSAPVARGKPIKPSKDGYVQVLVPPTEKVKIHEDGTANFRDIKAFREVKKGDVLAKKIPPFAGENGINIYKKVVFPRNPNKGHIQHGKNIKYNDKTNEYVALVDGVFEERENWIDINPVMTIDFHIGLETGNIDYLGEVLVNGNIEREASTKAKGNIIVEGVIESGKVNSGASIIAKTGINTRRDRRMMAKADVKANYIEHSNVMAGRDIIVGKSIVNSKIAAMRDIRLLSRDSAIINSHVTGYNNIEASTIGGRAGSKTTIILGKHVVNEEEYLEAKSKLQNFNKDFQRKLEKVKELKEYIELMKGRLNKVQIDRIKKEFNEYKAASNQREKLKQREQQLKSAAYNPKPAKLIVRNIIYPGVEINYKNTFFRIEVERRNVVYTFHPESEKYFIQPYK